MNGCAGLAAHASNPITGSAHCMLAPHWGAHLQRQNGRFSGVVEPYVEVRGERVTLGGDEVVVATGEIATGAGQRTL